MTIYVKNSLYKEEKKKKARVYFLQFNYVAKIAK